MSVENKLILAEKKLKFATELLNNNKAPLVSHEKKHDELTSHIKDLRKDIKEALDMTQENKQKICNMVKDKDHIIEKSVFYGHLKSEAQKFQKRAQADVELTGFSNNFEYNLGNAYGDPLCQDQFYPRR